MADLVIVRPVSSDETSAPGAASAVEAWPGGSAGFPYADVVDEYQRVGKARVGADLLAALDAARARTADPGLAAFLDVALDKHDGVYDYPSYTALPLLALPAGRQVPALRTARDRLLVLLAADLLRFELAALDDPAGVPLPGLRPSPAVVRKRCRLVLRSVAPSLRRLRVPRVLGDDLERARAVCAAVRRLATPAERRALALSVLPVDTLHDEYLFLRVLQSFEATFALAAGALAGVPEALDEADVEDAAGRLRAAALALREAAPLFSLLATMQVAAFRAFRTETEGASAIQSCGYKSVESGCRRPAPDRLDSVAYTSVPPVRDRVLAGQRDAHQAVEAALAGDLLGVTDRTELTAAAREFDAAHGRWRQTHYGVAVRMLGEGSGTGYTEGTPYLRSLLGVRLFGDLPPVTDDLREAS